MITKQLFMDALQKKQNAKNIKLANEKNNASADAELFLSELENKIIDGDFYVYSDDIAHFCLPRLSDPAFSCVKDNLLKLSIDISLGRSTLPRDHRFYSLKFMNNQPSSSDERFFHGRTRFDSMEDKLDFILSLLLNKSRDRRQRSLFLR